MENPIHKRVGYFFFAFLFFIIFTGIFSAIPETKELAIGIGAGASLCCVLALIFWSNRRYLAFSLRSMLICIITLQLPIVLMVNPWNERDVDLIGGVLMVIWAIFVYLFVMDAALARYTRERSLERLQMEEPDKIDRFKHGP